MKSSTNKVKILNDPIYGFITIPNRLIFELIQHPYFQRLRRVTQMGLSNLVYPGAHHTRFHHAIGCMHLMQKSIDILRRKGVQISDAEYNGLCIAILLHDIGHGPFSHALEHSIVEGISHETISLMFMKQLNKEFHGQLDLAIQIFEGNYSRKFMYQLISSQLDMDRLDYLKRDSFYTGVAEGNINSLRMIELLNVVDDVLVIEGKGIYSVEKFLIGRRLMYWQVYLHKTAVAAEGMLVKLLARAKQLALLGEELPSSKALHFFLYNTINEENFDLKTLKTFSRLDDYDLLSAIKDWISHDDKLLSKFSEMIINRKIFKCEISQQPFEKAYVAKLKQDLIHTGWTEEETDSFVFEQTLNNQAYKRGEESIYVAYKDGTIVDFIDAPDQEHMQILSKPVIKYILCYPKENMLAL